jgi:ribulose-5-phosphate 4-epimerase/fuculose-1-phosphate aldolase
MTHHTETQLRTDLAAAFRWAARLNLHESIANHFSLATSTDGKQFLLNPVGAHFSSIKASDLLLLDANADSAPGAGPTAWTLHGQLHQALPQARCILHTHMDHATALCCLQDFEFLMLDQNACRFHQRIAYDRQYDGMALHPQEGARVAALMAGGKSVLFMANHGVIVVGQSVAQAFDLLYYLERAARLQLLAMSSGRPLQLVPDALAAKVQAQWAHYPTEFSDLHFAALKKILDQQESDHRA